MHELAAVPRGMEVLSPSAAGRLIVRQVDENGKPSPSWHVMRPGQTMGTAEWMLDRGLDAVKRLSPASPLRAEIARWVAKLSDEWPPPPGVYKTGARSAIILEEATASNLAAARARSANAAEEARLARPATPKRSPATKGRTPAQVRAAVRKI